MSKQNSTILWSIKELYEWAVENGYEDYTAFTEREGCDFNLYTDEFLIDDKNKIISL